MINITFIIPVYNGEKYILDTIQSVVHQKDINHELIIVNDGSTDGTKLIVEDYISNSTFKEIKLINIVNNGVSSARNIGLRYAKGHYVSFVDADDLLDLSFAKEFYSKAIINSSDFVFSTNHIRSHKDEKYISDDIHLLDNETATSELLLNNITIGCWNKIFKKEFLEMNSLCFNESLFFGEGLKFITDVSQRAKNIICTTDKLYYYRLNTDSCTANYSIAKAEASFDSLNLIRSDLVISTNRINDVLNSHFWVNNFLKIRFIVGSKDIIKNEVSLNESINYIRSNLRHIYIDGVPLSIKLSAPILCFFPVLFSRVFNFLKESQMS